MSLKSTKEQLTQLLADKDNKVIALSGKWGTGKSYMWDQVKKSSTDETVGIPQPFGHLFHEHPATDSTVIRPPIPRTSGHP